MANGNGQLKAIAKRLKELGEKKRALEAEEKALWDTFFQLADRRVGEGKPFRYLDPELKIVIGRQVAVIERIDEKRLQELLNPEQWKLVTRVERVLDPTLLESAIIRGKVDPDLVKQAQERKEQIRRFGPRQPNKDELKALEAEEAR